MRPRGNDIQDPALLRAWHRVIVLYFGMFGVIGSSVMVRLPQIKESLGIGASHLGVVLLVGSIGSILSLNISGRLIERIGTRPAIVVGMFLLTGASIAQMWAAEHGLVPAYAALGFFVGCAYGLSDVAMNLDGTVLERRIGRTLMPRMHASYSVGTLAGAGIGTLLTYLDVSLLLQVAVIASTQSVIVARTMRHIPHGTGISAHHAEGGVVDRGHWLTPTVWAMGIALLSITLGEGSANDWLAIGIVSDYHASRTHAGIVFSVFNLAMTITRFYGGNLADRYGKGRTLRGFAIVGAIGVVIVILGTPHVIVACIGAAFWGAGVANAFPLLLSAAGEADHAPKRVAFVAFWGYGAFIAGPPLLGFLGQSWGMLRMFWLIAMFLGIGATFAGAASASRKPANAEPTA